ncbi:hypothetical protein BDQ17DRAFT_1342932 [Cyathus striatus]|nr:hypothetical protein BDQ17DRAFT_1342932 [Cyathus striatus]
MPKRRVADSDDDESPSLDSKRARTADNSEDEEPRQRVKSTRNKGKGKARQVESDAEDAEGEVDELEESVQPEASFDEEAFERANAEKLRAVLDSKRKVQGGIAEHGIIESIIMVNFMCHKYLSFNFGPQINFIIGHNGSGKSAVLSAITVALGGKSTSTGRGSGLRSFILEGQTASEVTITLKNQGDEAFKPHEYGKSIIKSKDGRVVSTKKDELAAICDHMNIQVDNPMTVLTQDAARQFLSASHPQDKYKFFLRGTQLSQLADEYDQCLENITQTSKILAQKREAIPDLKTTFREATMRFQEASKALEQRKKKDDLKKELAWAYVRDKEDQMRNKLQEVARESRRLPKIQENVDAAQAALEQAEADVVAYESERKNMGDIDHFHQRKSELQNEMKDNKSRLTEINSDVKQMNVSIAALNETITKFEQQISEEASKMAAHTQARRGQAQHKLEAVRESIQDIESQLEGIRDQKRNEGALSATVKEEGMKADQRLKELQSQIGHCDHMIKQCQQQEKDTLIPYGRNMKQVLERIDQMRWMGDKPLGPLGLYVKAKDPETWGTLWRDRAQLKKLLVETGNPGNLIFIFEKDLFDYRSGEPPENVLTVLRALDISDPYVLRILINQSRIERQLLSDTRLEGEKQLQRLGGGSAWTKDQFNVRVFPDGVSSIPLDFRRTNDGTNLLLTGRDSASEIRHYEQEKSQHEIEYHQVLRYIDEKKAEFQRHRREADRLQSIDTQMMGQLSKHKVTLANLQQEANDDLPAQVAGLEAAKKEAEDEKQNIVTQFTDVMEQKNQIDAAQRELLGQLNEVKKQIERFGEMSRGALSKVDQAVDARMKAIASKKHYEQKLATEQQQIDALQAEADVLEQEFANWTENAKKFSERIEGPRPTAELQRLLKSVETALKEKENEQGATVEDLAREVNKSKDRLVKQETELREMAKLNKALKASLIIRLSRWQEFRRHIALRCKLVFQYHLSHRGYFGKVLFNHDQGTLVLKVQTDDQISTQGGRDKDPRSLSGGEKSFSTICLLLSLWESIGCPLRCLDEFDVFMDAVNRRISMKMMIDTANSSDKKQYVLITPQDMTNVQFGPSVRVHRMSDPERGNGTLAFN